MRNNVLLTATIKPQENIPFLSLKDEKIRLNQYLESIMFWLERKTVDKIIFCDNSNFDFNFDKLIKISNYKGKKIEFLKFEGSKQSIIYGKGYGEGEIIKYAIKNSKLLQNESFFYKITGRLMVKNFDFFSFLNKKNSNIFFSTNKNIVDTRFFKVDKSFYMDYLANEYKKVNDKQEHYLEHVFYEKLLNCKELLSKSLIMPYIIGVSGSTGEEYKKNIIKYFYRNIKLITGRYTI